MCPRRIKQAEDGFTLVEMLVVVTIVALVGLAAAGHMPQAQATGSSARLIARARYSVSEARRQAMLTGAAVAVPVAQTGPAGKTLHIQRPDGGQLVFYGDGSSTGGVLLIDGKHLFDVDVLTGTLRPARGDGVA